MKKAICLLLLSVLLCACLPAATAENIIMIRDDADLLTTEEEAELYLAMAPIRAYCTPVFWSTDAADDRTTLEKAYALMQGLIGTDDGVAFIIDMHQREIAIRTTDGVSDALTEELINEILENTFGLASEGRFAECAEASFTGVLSVLSGDELTFDPIPAEPKPAATPLTDSEPSGERMDVRARLGYFLGYWNANDLDSLTELCAPSWRAEQENEKTSLFVLLQNRRPVSYTLEEEHGSVDDGEIRFDMNVNIDRNNGKEPVIYRMSIRMVRENGSWYADPLSLQTIEYTETERPEEQPEPTPMPVPDANTVLYYNPEGGAMYHLDPNCKIVHEKYQPLQGTFTWSQVNDEPYAGLQPCNVCGAPLRP